MGYRGPQNASKSSGNIVNTLQHYPQTHFKTFLGGVIFHPKSPNPPLRVLGTYRPDKTAETSTGPSCAAPKPVCRGPCGQPRAWMSPTVSQDTTQSLWGPTLGSPRHPESSKIQLVKFSPFSSQICLAKLPKPPWDHLVRPQNPSAGVPADNQVLGCLLQCPKTPHSHYGTLPWGPQGTLGPGKSNL